MLELQNICYRVSTPDGEQDILKNVSITIPDHRLVVFTGPNGGGKTTLAKVIMGLVQPTSGRVLYNGEDVTELSITERARRGISYGFQQPPRFKGITVHDLLLLAAGQEKLSKDRCCAYLTKVGLCANDYLDREVDVSLSGGEVKRIEIATILVTHQINAIKHDCLPDFFKVRTKIVDAVRIMNAAVFFNLVNGTQAVFNDKQRHVIAIRQQVERVAQANGIDWPIPVALLQERIVRYGLENIVQVVRSNVFCRNGH